ncbi:solute carrier family 2, facilitated glucose transporter member 5-like isoform X8 [Grus americana]|uniref:solute carrier family 2, facilitated glucose transporter member 5-like isoform X8 n=1 Tax=Grus americana TaxID=9117 RepID=UPI002408713B|nr:solute carrier family 2, facilitated glucose transporter member 5-like isoform X8 [Grus americana]
MNVMSSLIWAGRRMELSQQNLPSWTLFLAVCAVGIGGTFQYGYNVSIINAPTQHIHKFLNETWTSRYHKELNPDLLTFLWSVIASIFSLGGLCGALIGGSMAIRLGRKGALLMNNIIAILACILMGISFPTGLFELLIIGRFLIGINSGIGICVQPLYIGEIAPKHLRGGMAMGTSIFLTGGILTGQIIGLRELLGGETYWPLLLSSSCFPAFAQLLFLPWFPESPRYLLIDRGDELSCAKALKRFHGSSEYQREMEDIQRERFALDGEKPKKPWQLFTDRGVRWQLITVIVMTMGQQLSGINAELYSWVPYVSMTSIFAFILSFGLGPGGITNTLTAELFIQSSRPAAYMIGGTTSWISFFTIGMLFPFIVNELKQYCFLVFLLECSLVAAFIFLVIPETKNKSFLEIKKEFHKLNFGRNTEKKDTELYERRQLRDEF